MNGLSPWIKTLLTVVAGAFAFGAAYANLLSADAVLFDDVRRNREAIQEHDSRIRAVEDRFRLVDGKLDRILGALEGGK